MLYSGEMNILVNKHFANQNDKENWQEDTIQVHVQGIAVDVNFFYNRNKNAIVIPAPLAVKEVMAGDFFEPSYQTAISAIETRIGNSRFSVSTSLIGKGAGALHYVAFHKDHDGRMAIFDSKFSDPERFLNSADKPNLPEKIWGYLTAPIRFIAFKLGFGHTTQSVFLGKEIAVHRLGTQPALDWVSCGYHSGGAVLTMMDVIDQENQPSLASITQTIKRMKDMDLKAENLLKPAAPALVPPISSALSVLGGSAQQDTRGPQLELERAPIQTTGLTVRSAWIHDEEEANTGMAMNV